MTSERKSSLPNLNRNKRYWKKLLSPAALNNLLEKRNFDAWIIVTLNLCSHFSQQLVMGMLIVPQNITLLFYTLIFIQFSFNFLAFHFFPTWPKYVNNLHLFSILRYRNLHMYCYWKRLKTNKRDIVYSLQCMLTDMGTIT